MSTRPSNAREHLYAIFGNDISYLPGELDIAARHHRELAAGLRRRNPDGLITELGARHLADGHDWDAQRCDRIAGLIRRTLDDNDAGSEPGDAGTAAQPSPARRPLVVAVTGDVHLRSALDVAKHHARVHVAHCDNAAKARTAAKNAALLIVGVDMAFWFTAPVPAAGPTAVIGFDPLDRAAAAEHAHRLGADLFVLRPPGHEPLTALLRKVSGEPGAAA